MRHPAKYSDSIIQAMQGVLAQFSGVILDPFAGTGRVHQLANERIKTIGIELEHEWASLHNDTIHGSVLAASLLVEPVDGIVTSPCYGNRMADNYNAKDTSIRHNYRSCLGRTLSKDSAAGLQWGMAYRGFHMRAWVEVLKCLKPEGLFVLNISDHIRKGVVQPVTAWHKATLADLGVEWKQEIPVPTRRQRQGENHAARVNNEVVLVGTYAT